MHANTGKPGKDYTASPENLLRYLFAKQKLPDINLLVDIYNLVSIKTKLALGAHDTRHINGNVNLRLTNGDEHFIPLGYKESKPAGTGVYAYIDDANDVLCWMEVRQVEKTKITLDTSECFYIVQGSKETPAKYIKSVCEELIFLTKRFCGGEETYLFIPDSY